MLFQLKCDTCNVVLPSIGATRPGELLEINAELLEEFAERSLDRRVQTFCQNHAGHCLVEERIDQ